MVWLMSVALVLLVFAAIALRKTHPAQSELYPNTESDVLFTPAEPPPFGEPPFTKSNFEPGLADIDTDTRDWTI
jgi:hypothetical protein